MNLRSIIPGNKLLAAIPVAAALLLSNAAELPAQTLSKLQIRQKYLITQVTRQDFAILLKDASPALLQRLGSDPETKKKQVTAVRELLATASQAINEGLVTPDEIFELENIRIESTAVVYDDKVLKNKSVRFGGITKERIEAFYAKPGNTAKFDDYLDRKLEALKKLGTMPGYKPNADEIAQVRDYFARSRIYEAESRLKAKTIGLAFAREANLQAKLQMAQFLAKLYGEKVLDEKVKITDEAVRAYIDSHPEFTLPKKQKAAQILSRARSGEDFAKLANEYTEDPGNGGEDGSTPQGGIYRNVKKGVMIPAFEQAALALSDGQVSPDLTETIYGYHIIKLENKRHTKGEDGVSSYVYDVRHILISTQAKDPDDPSSTPQPLTQMVRARLERAAEKREMDLIVKKNPVVVAADFVVPKVTEEQIREAARSGTGPGAIGPGNVEVSKPADDVEPPRLSPPPPPSAIQRPDPPLSPNIRADLNLAYKGWIKAPGSEFCSAEYRNSVVMGDMNGDGKTDFVVKIAVGNKGYLVAYLADETGYKRHLLNSMTAAEAGSSALGIFEKGGKWPLGEPGEADSQEIAVDNDAVFFGPCASDNTGLYIFKDGKFTGI